MRLYLMRHGDSLDSQIDAIRPLSPKGRKETAALGQFLSKLNLSLDKIIHSGKLRAKETAEIMAQHLNFTHSIETQKGLDPLDEVIAFANELDNYSENILVVGHLPFVNRLTSFLTTHNENFLLTDFETSTILCLERLQSGHWHIIFMMSGTFVYPLYFNA